MKRSAIQRKKPMVRKPAAYPPKKLIKRREEWAKQFDHCMVCGSVLTEPNGGYATTHKEVHHIAPRSRAPKRFEHPANWLATCRSCHEAIHGEPMIVGNAFAALLACKLIYDEPNFDFAAWLMLLGEGSNRVTIDEVMAAHDMHILLRHENIRRILRARSGT